MVMRSTVPTRHLLLAVLPALLPVLLGGCHGRLKNPTPSIRTRIEKAGESAVETYPWPDYVTGEDRVRIEDAISTIFDVGGRDAVDAELILVEMDRKAAATDLRVCGRLVSEMKTVIDRHGVDEYEGKSRIMVLDRILRKIDGVQERRFGEEYGLDIDDSAAKALRLVGRWNWWYREGRFIQRFEPWDPRVDMKDDEDEDTDLNPKD